MSSEMKEKESGTKGIGIIMIILIIITWLSVMALLIKCDVGGFGSEVLRPVFKDVPVINWILPEASDAEVIKESGYPYTNLKDALDRIAVLEASVGSKEAEIVSLTDKVTELQAEVSRLSVYEAEQEEFEVKKIEFFEEIVYGENAPGFSSLFVEDMECEDLKEFYGEFLKYQSDCKFIGCVHIKEPVCGVKKALLEGKISQLRYDNYRQLYEELKTKKKW